MEINIENVSACIILNKNNEIFLQKKTQEYVHPGVWTLFGGHIEENETPEQAMVRELNEELGIKFNLEKIKKIKEYIFQKKDNSKIKFHIFSLTFDKDISEIKIGEGCGVAFFTKEEIKKINIIPFNFQIITEFLNNKE